MTRRIDTPNRQVNLFGVGKDGFRDGNKAAFINPTELSAGFMNMLQEELAGIVEAAGLVLDPNNNNQLLQAVVKLGGGGAKTKIVVLGHSHTCANTLLPTTWPNIVGKILNDSGAAVDVFSLGIAGHTHFRANTVATHGLNTAVQEAIALAPNIIFVQYALNDAILGAITDNRTLVQIKADADTLFSTLRTALPNCKIIYVSEVCYDSANFTPASALNKGVIPSSWNLTTAGILNGSYCSEILDIAITAGTQTAYSNWVAQDTYIKANANINGFVTLNQWKIARMGCYAQDGYHPSEEGGWMQAAYIVEGFRGLGFTSAMFPNLAQQNTPALYNTDSLFSALLTVSGTGYVPTATTYATTAERITSDSGPYKKLNLVNWFLPFKTEFIHTPLAKKSDLQERTTNICLNGPPNQLIYVSVDGGAFSSTASSTDSQGNFFNVGNNWTQSSGYNTTGAHILRYKIDAEIYGPFAITNSGAANPEFFAQTSVAVAYTVATDVPVTWNSTSIDNFIGMAGATGIYTVPQSGRYQIGWCVRASSVAAANIFCSELWVSGIRYIDGNTVIATAAAQPMGSSGSVTLDLAAAATLQIKGQAAGSSLTGTTVASNNWLSIVRVG